MPSALTQPDTKRWGQEDRAVERQSWGETEAMGMGMEREREIQSCVHAARIKTKTSPPLQPQASSESPGDEDLGRH